MGQSTTVIPTGGGGAKVQDSIPTNPQKGDFWVDTSQDIPAVKWYDGTAFVEVESRIGYVDTTSDLPEQDPAQIYYIGSTGDYIRSKVPFGIASATYTGTSLATQDSIATGLAWKPDGTKLWEVGEGSDKIYEYDVSTAFDISTASHTGTTLATQASVPTGLAWKPDGTKLWEIARFSNTEIYEYDVSTAFDISTASHTGTTLVTQDSRPTDLAWKPDGTKLWETGYGSSRIYEYDVSTAFDISTASHTGTTLGTQDGYPKGLAWKPDGTKLWEDSDKIYEYDVSTAFDISTASHNDRTLTTQGSDNRGLAWKPDGTKLWEVGADSAQIYEYSLDYETF